MTNIFLVRYRDGGLMIESLPVTNSKRTRGQLTKKALESLSYRGYSAWVNLTNCLDDQRYGLAEMLSKEFGI